jgi:hypothetical protein
VSGGWKRSTLISSLISLSNIARTWVGAVKQIGNFRHIFKPFLVYVTLLSQFGRVFTCQFEWGVTAQCTAPVIQQDWEGEFPLLYLTVHHVVHLILDQLQQLAHV